VAFVITAGGLPVALATPAPPMLGAAVGLGRTVKVVMGADVEDGAAVAPALLGLADADALGLAEALARGDIEGEAEGRGAAGAGNTGGSTNGVSMIRSTVRANPSDIARSSSASVAPNAVRRSKCVIFALSLASGETQSRSPASFGEAIPLLENRERVFYETIDAV